MAFTELLEAVSKTSYFVDKSIFLNFILDLKIVCEVANDIAGCLGRELDDCLAEEVDQCQH
jgi:hypothetical protein